MFDESPQLSTSGSARLLVTIQSNKLLLLAAACHVIWSRGSVRKRHQEVIENRVYVSVANVNAETYKDDDTATIIVKREKSKKRGYGSVSG